MPFSRLVYFSENQLDPRKGSALGQLSKILKASNRNNQTLGITGALVFDDLWFIQTLEGERTKILATFERLKDDERHSNISLVELTDVDDRMFGNWWMGLATRNDATQQAFKPYLHNGRMQPHQMSGKQLLGLIVEVSKLGLAREVLTPVGA
jgi:hypothetical protein